MGSVLEEPAKAAARPPSVSAAGIEHALVNTIRRSPRLILRTARRLLGVPIPHYLQASRFLFIEIPKNASMSISRAIYGREVSHRTALFYRDIDPEFFASRLSFAVVRNPWDRFVSTYEFYRSGGTKEAQPGEPPDPRYLTDFETFVFEYLVPNIGRLNTLDDAIREQSIFVNDREGECLVNFLGRFEDLAGFQEVLIQKGVISSPIPRINASSGRNTRDYRHYYVRPALVDAVGQCYARDVHQFGYRFE